MKPSRSLRPNHSWLRNFFVVMGANLRAGWGAKYSVRRATLQNENVYSRAADSPATIFLHGRVLVRFPRMCGSPKQIRRSALCQAFQAKQNLPMISQVGSGGSEMRPLPRVGSGYRGIATNSLSRDSASSLPLSVMQFVFIR